MAITAPKKSKVPHWPKIKRGEIPQCFTGDENSIPCFLTLRSCIKFFVPCSLVKHKKKHARSILEQIIPMVKGHHDRFINVKLDGKEERLYLCSDMPLILVKRA